MQSNGMSLKSIICIIIILLLIIAGGIYIIFGMTGPKEEPSVPTAEYKPNPQNDMPQMEVPVVDIDIPQSDFHLTKDEYPKIDGATAMRPMSVQIAKEVIGLSDAQADEFVVHNTTSKAYQNLIDKKVDLIFVSEPSNDIINKAKNAGVEFEMAGIGRDGFVFVVNKANPINSLTIKQIQDIYTGRIKNWSEVGGENERIVAYQREANSGSQNLMEKMVMNGLEMTDVPTEYMITNMEGLIENVASYSNAKNALGYSIYLYAKEQYVRDSIKFLSIDGIYPSDETIADGTYPLSKIVYAICRKDEPADSNARKLVEWLKTTDEGQKVVESGGYVGIK